MTTSCQPPGPRFLLLSAVLAWAGVVVCLLLVQASAGGRLLLCSSQFDCRAVLSSSYAAVWGVPLPWLGAAFYSGLLVLLLLALAVGSSVLRRRALMLALWVGVVGGSFTLGLVYIQFRVLHAFCGLCMVSAIILLALTITMGLAVRTDSEAFHGLPGAALAMAAFAIMAAAGLCLAMPAPADEVVAEVGTRKFLRSEMDRDLRQEAQPMTEKIHTLEMEWVRKKIDATLLALEA